jgi:hypothetical protein
MAVRHTRTLLGVPRVLDLGSRSGLIGLITLEVKCAGAHSAEIRTIRAMWHGARNQFTARLVRDSQRNGEQTDRRTNE